MLIPPSDTLRAFMIFDPGREEARVDSTSVRRERAVSA